MEKTIYLDPAFQEVPETITVKSSAFAEGEAIPAKYTEDGAKLSPPVSWSNVPEAAQSLVLVIEDADSPTPAPIVHTLALDLAAGDGELAEGALRSPGNDNAVGYKLGHNTFLKSAYLPPDPPPGGGAHRYVFQVYALSKPTGLEEGAGRSAVKEALNERVLARGKLIGTYERN